jgi:hypothetical protein
LRNLLELPQPEPVHEDTRENAYVFERRVTFRHGDGSVSAGFVDLYRRGAFMLEAKKLRKADGKGFDDAMLRARGQAEQYARALPAAEGRPPLADDALAVHFTGRGPWKKRLPQIVETLVSLGRARRVDGGVIGAN